jgi:hypothetical protein
LAWPGEDPQQVVSPGPGMRDADAPETEACAESSFLSFRLPQDAHSTRSVVEARRISLVSPQSLHRYSKIGIVLPSRKLPGIRPESFDMSI